MKKGKVGRSSFLILLVVIAAASQLFPSPGDRKDGSRPVATYVGRYTAVPTTKAQAALATLPPKSNTKPVQTIAPLPTFSLLKQEKTITQPVATTGFSQTTLAKYSSLSVGDSSSAVRALKEELQDLGYYSATMLNNSYTSHTAGVVRDFQARNKLPVTGIADATTQAMLFSGFALSAAGQVAVKPQESRLQISSGGSWSGTTARATLKPVVTAKPSAPETYVWIPRTGAKYHRTSTCSNMKNPNQVTRSAAISMGYDPCKKCKPR